MSVGVTSNCGMQALTGVSVCVSGKPDEWGDVKYIQGKQLSSVVDQHWDWIVSTILRNLTKGLIVISDRMLYGGRAENIINVFGTKHFIRELINRRVGDITVSPLVRNMSYEAGAHDIQAVFWVPPSNSSTVVCEGKLLPDEKQASSVSYKKAHAKSYEKWINEQLPVNVREEWAAAPPSPEDLADPKRRFELFFESGNRIETLRQLYLNGPYAEVVVRKAKAAAAKERTAAKIKKATTT